MKNIYELLKAIGVEVPEDKKAEFDKALNENYKTISEMKRRLLPIRSAPICAICTSLLRIWTSFVPCRCRR